MWRITIILNAILMAVFGLGSAASQIRLRNYFVQYPDTGERMPGGLPGVSAVALRLQWVYQVVPLAWILITLVLLIVYWKKPESSRDMAQLHTSITLLAGVFMLGFFVVAGSVPFVQLVVKLQ